ncbi:MAG: EamA family transporter [Anaerolineaceae bacterium]|nr:EamA family transporter [Anaerolineaceae bacterium]
MTLAPEIAVIVFGLLASMSWGTADFNGGLASRRLPAVAVVALAHLLGLLLLFGLAIVTQETVPSYMDFVWGALAGLAGAVGLVSFYQALSYGRMGIAAPLVAVLATSIPLIVGILSAGLPPPVQLFGFGIGLISLVLVSYSDGRLPDQRTLLLALSGGIGFGAFLILIHKVESQAVFWPLVAARAASSLILLLIARFMRLNLRPSDGRHLFTVIMAGLLDIVGNIFFMLASRAGRLDIAAVLSSLYPAMTVFLAWVFLKERLTRVQIVGIVAALVAIALISLPTS